MSLQPCSGTTINAPPYGGDPVDDSASASRIPTERLLLPPEFVDSLNADVHEACDQDQFALLTPEELQTLRSLGPLFINSHSVLLRHLPLKKFLAFKPEILDRLKPDVLADMEDEVLDGIDPTIWNAFTDEMFEVLDASFLNKLGEEYIGRLTWTAFEHLVDPSMSTAEKAEVLAAQTHDSLRLFFLQLPEKIFQRAIERKQKQDEERKQTAYIGAVRQQALCFGLLGAGWLGGTSISMNTRQCSVAGGLSSARFTAATNQAARTVADPLLSIAVGTCGLAILTNLFSIARQMPTWGPEEYLALGTVAVAAGAGVVLFAPGAGGVLGLGLATTTAGSILTLPVARLGKKLWSYGKHLWHTPQQREPMSADPTIVATIKAAQEECQQAFRTTVKATKNLQNVITDQQIFAELMRQSPRPPEQLKMLMERYGAEEEAALSAKMQEKYTEMVTLIHRAQSANRLLVQEKRALIQRLERTLPESEQKRNHNDPFPSPGTLRHDLHWLNDWLTLLRIQQRNLEERFPGLSDA